MSPRKEGILPYSHLRHLHGRFAWCAIDCVLAILVLLLQRPDLRVVEVLQCVDLYAGLVVDLLHHRELEGGPSCIHVAVIQPAQPTQPLKLHLSFCIHISAGLCQLLE